MGGGAYNKSLIATSLAVLLNASFCFANTPILTTNSTTGDQSSTAGISWKNKSNIFLPQNASQTITSLNFEFGNTAGASFTSTGTTNHTITSGASIHTITINARGNTSQANSIQIGEDGTGTLGIKFNAGSTQTFEMINLRGTDNFQTNSSPSFVGNIALSGSGNLRLGLDSNQANKTLYLKGGISNTKGTTTITLQNNTLISNEGINKSALLADGNNESAKNILISSKANGNLTLIIKGDILARTEGGKGAYGVRAQNIIKAQNNSTKGVLRLTAQNIIAKGNSTGGYGDGGGNTFLGGQNSSIIAETITASGIKSINNAENNFYLQATNDNTTIIAKELQSLSRPVDNRALSVYNRLVIASSSIDDITKLKVDNFTTTLQFDQLAGKITVKDAAHEAQHAIKSDIGGVNLLAAKEIDTTQLYAGGGGKNRGSTNLLYAQKITATLVHAASNYGFFGTAQNTLKAKNIEIAANNQTAIKAERRGNNTLEADSITIIGGTGDNAAILASAKEPGPRNNWGETTNHFLVGQKLSVRGDIVARNGDGAEEGTNGAYYVKSHNLIDAKEDSTIKLVGNLTAVAPKNWDLDANGERFNGIHIKTTKEANSLSNLNEMKKARPTNTVLITGSITAQANSSASNRVVVGTFIGNNDITKLNVNNLSTSIATLGGKIKVDTSNEFSIKAQDGAKNLLAAKVIEASGGLFAQWNFSTNTLYGKSIIISGGSGNALYADWGNNILTASTSAGDGNISIIGNIVAQAGNGTTSGKNVFLLDSGEISGDIIIASSSDGNGANGKGSNEFTLKNGTLTLRGNGEGISKFSFDGSSTLGEDKTVISGKLVLAKHSGAYNITTLTGSDLYRHIDFAAEGITLTLGASSNPSYETEASKTTIFSFNQGVNTATIASKISSSSRGATEFVVSDTDLTLNFKNTDSSIPVGSESGTISYLLSNSSLEVKSGNSVGHYTSATLGGERGVTKIIASGASTLKNNINSSGGIVDIELGDGSLSLKGTTSLSNSATGEINLTFDSSKPSTLNLLGNQYQLSNLDNSSASFLDNTINLVSQRQENSSNFTLLEIGKENAGGLKSNSSLRFKLLVNKDASNGSLGGDTSSNDKTTNYGYVYSDRVIVYKNANDKTSPSSQKHLLALFPEASLITAGITHQKGKGTETKGNIAVATVKNDLSSSTSLASAPITSSVPNSSSITFEAEEIKIGSQVISIALTPEQTDKSGEANLSGGYTTYFIGEAKGKEIALEDQKLYSSALMINYDLFIANFNSLNKRLGELRDNPNANGIWARVFGGELSNNFGAGSQTTYLTTQAGYDYAFGLNGANNYLGLALSYAHSSSRSNAQTQSAVSLAGEIGSIVTLDNIKTNAFEFAIYNSYVGDGASSESLKNGEWLKGFYADSIFKVGLLKSVFDIQDASGTRDLQSKNLSLSFSQEVGYSFLLGGNKEWSITPEYELGIGYLGEGSFVDHQNYQGVMTSTKVIQEAVLTLRNRAGIQWGYTTTSYQSNTPTNTNNITSNHPQAGAKVYIGTYYEYDYIKGGESSFKGNLISYTNTLQSLQSNGRFVLNLGSNITLNKDTRLYVDIEKSFGGKINTDLQFNFGARFSFGENRSYKPLQKGERGERENKAPIKIEEK